MTDDIGDADLLRQCSPGAAGDAGGGLCRVLCPIINGNRCWPSCDRQDSCCRGYERRDTVFLRAVLHTVPAAGAGTRGCCSGRPPPVNTCLSSSKGLQIFTVAILSSSWSKLLCRSNTVTSPSREAGNVSPGGEETSGSAERITGQIGESSLARSPPLTVHDKDRLLMPPRRLLRRGTARPRVPIQIINSSWTNSASGWRVRMLSRHAGVSWKEKP